MGNQEEQAIEGCAQPPSKTAVSEEDIPSEDVEACLLTQSLRLSVTQISLAAHLQQIENMAMRGRHEKEASSEQALLYVEEMKERYESMRATREAELRHISVFAACLYNLFLPEKKSAEEGCSSSSSSTLMVDKKNDPRHKLAVHAVLEGMQALQLASAEEDLEAAKLLSAAVDRGLQCIRFYSDNNRSNDQEKVLGRKEVHDLLSIYIHLLCLHPAEVLPWAASPTLLLLTFFSSSSDDNNEVSLEKLRLRLLIAVLPLTLTSSSALLASSLAVASLAQTPVCFSMWQQSTSKFTPVLMERLHSLLNSSFESGSCDYTYWPDPVTMHRKAYFIIPKPSSHKYKELIAVLDVVKAILIIGDESLFIQTIHVLRSSSLLVAYRNAIIAQPLEKTSVYMAYDAETTIAGAGLPSVWNKCMEIVVLVLSYQTFSFSAPAFVALTEALHLFMFHYHPLLRVILKPPTAGGVVSLASLDQKAQVIQLLYRLRTLPMRNSVLPPALDQEFIRSVSATLALFAHCLQPHHVIDCLSISPLEKQLLSPSSKGSLTETGQEKERALILSEEEGCGLPAEVEVRTFRVVSAALSLLRLQFPERVVDKDVTTGYFAAGSEVYFESITVRHAVVKGIVLSIKHNNVEGVGKRGAKYTLRLMDGSREDHVPEDRVLYSSPPLFTLEHFLPADPAVSLSPSSSSSWYHGDIAFGSTAHLLALLNYTLHRSTELRLERYSDAFSPQKTAEELLGLLVVSLLHLSLAPVDRHLLYDVVADVLDSITATEEGRKASWVQSADWEVFAHWAKTLLPLPPMETEEVSPVQEIALPKTFKKGGHLRSHISYVSVQDIID